eukprot:TRINITY_DN517_c0_g1_i1.p1 TRINITY_DN517_c0_g1~~TRINITY_DN517_c0_g1_i1.p1  ORF type:complete len:391 (+),score=99.57 TRINITY_DN517_c0_g1_i1:76-1248(+)
MSISLRSILFFCVIITLNILLWFYFNQNNNHFYFLNSDQQNEKICFSSNQNKNNNGNQNTISNSNNNHNNITLNENSNTNKTFDDDLNNLMNNILKIKNTNTNTNENVKKSIFEKWNEKINKEYNNFEDFIKIQKESRDKLINGEKTERVKAVIFFVPDEMYCGGLGDRFNGIVSAFYLALMTNRAFFIYWMRPVNWEYFMQPKQIDWSWKTEWMVHFGETNISRRIFCINGCKDQLSAWQTQDLNSVWPEDIWWISINLMHADAFIYNPFFESQALHYNLFELDQLHILKHVALHSLFKPTPLVISQLSKISSHFDQLNISFSLGVHIRTGGDNGWNDPPRVPADGAMHIFFASLGARLLLPPQSSVIVFASDSQKNSSIYCSIFKFES